jgi:hypothetical protein
MNNTYVPRKSIDNTWINKNVNDIKIMKIHSSFLSLREKPKSPLLSSTGMCDELTEKPASLKSVGNTTRDLLINLHVPTNFKIEPLHFREEKNKEFLYDKYIVEDIIGQGSFGQVRRIKDKVTSRYRAIKIIKKTDCKMTDNYVNEIEIFKKMVIAHYNT